MKRDIFKALIAIMELALVVLAVMWVLGLFRSIGVAENAGERWVICQPEEKDGGYVSVREKAKKNSAEIGQLYLGSRVETDGKTKNGYLHIVNASTETGDGWVYAKYIVADEPVIETRQARVIGGGRVQLRACPGGKRIKWLRPGDRLTVYAWTNEWCVTDRGYVDSEYLAGE